MHAGRAHVLAREKVDFVYPAGGSVGKRDRTSEIGSIPLKLGYLDSLMHIHEPVQFLES